MTHKIKGMEKVLLVGPSGNVLKADPTTPGARLSEIFFEELRGLDHIHI